jgi:hypothetical protein
MSGLASADSKNRDASIGLVPWDKDFPQPRESVLLDLREVHDLISASDVWYDNCDRTGGES